MKIFNIQQQLRVENKRVAKWVSPLLFLVCFISFSNNVVAQQVVLNPLTASTATIQCAGGQTTITATVASGTGSYEYSLDNPSGPFGSVNTFSVGAGDHTIYVHDTGDNSYDDKSINISETPLTAGGVVASGKNWSCASCNGSLTVNITGGMPEYSIIISGAADLSGTTTGSSYTFSDLCNGTYQISVTDNCIPTVTVNVADYVIALDDAKPTCNNLPEDEFIPIAMYESMISSASLMNYPLLFDKSLPPLNTADHTGIDAYVNTTSGIPSNGFDNMELRINATAIGSGWLPSDMVNVSISYGPTNLYPQVVGFPGGTLTNVTIPINKTDQDDMRVLISWGDIATTGCSYVINSVELWGIPVQPIIHSYSEPSGCDNNIGIAAPIISHSDGPITWHCTVPEPELEFSFIRTWEVKDDCGNITTYPQRISVGTAPVITDPEDTIINYCHNQDVDIKAPVATDNCGILRYDWTMTNENNEPVTSGSCDAAGIVDYDFPQPVTADDSVFHITWTAVDNAGIPSDPEVQDVIIRRKMVVALDANIDDFCSGATVTFDVSVSGGSGLYSLPIITPTETLTDLGNGHVTFTTTALKYEPTALLDVVVNYTDLDNVGSDVAGGCTTGNVPFSSGGGVFTVHQKIVTNSISRNP